ncbi:MAG: two-component regulator propeller domain-containing protein [Bacteroidota bacterium]
MRPRLSFRLALFLVLALAAPASVAQTWTAFPAFNDVRAVASSQTAVWAATPAGIFSYEPDTGTFSRFTTVDGLRGGEIGDLAVDANGHVWIGYGDGALDRITPDTGEIRTFLDIERADQFASRGVNRIRPRDGQLLIATDFGLVVFDTERQEVRQTAARLGTLPAATPVRDVLVAPSPNGGDAFWLATDEGVTRASAASDNLQVPTAWTVEPDFATESYALAFFDGSVWASGLIGTFRDIYRRRADGTWERRAFINGPVATLITWNGALFGVLSSGSQTFVLRPGEPNRFYQSFPTAPRLQDIAVGPSGQIWVGDSGVGLFAYPEVPIGGSGAVPVSPEPVRPEGPFANEIVSIDLASDGTLWATTLAVAFGTSNTSSVSWLRDGIWQTIRADDPATELPDRSQNRIAVRPEGGALVGSEGRGMAIVTEAGAVTAFDESNSTLLPALGSSSFVVVNDFAREGDRWWVANGNSSRPLHAFPGTSDATLADWTALPSPPGTPTSFPIREVQIDPFGQKWIAMGNRGLLVWDTGADPLSPADDRGRTFSTGLSGQGLPNGDVTALAQDREGRLWIGTSRGIALVFSPGSAFAGDAALAEPQWARTADGTSFLLRDVNVRSMTVDPAGRLWIATTTGAYLLNAAGDTVLLRLDAASTPLPTDDIASIAVDGETGLVYIASASGLYAYQGDATAPNAASEALSLAPNPFRPNQHTDILVSGLQAAATRVRVLTVDGRVVYRDDEVFGGSFRWDGRDEQTGERVPSGVYLVTASGANGEGTIYGRLAVIQ